MPGSKWFVFVSHYAATAAATGSKLLEKGVEAWVPLERRLYRRPGAKAQIRENALFGPYGFVRFDKSIGYDHILGCDGVRDILPSRTNPMMVPGLLVEALQVAEKVGMFDHTKPPKVGVRVELMEGPFAGEVGRIVKARSSDRVKVALKMMFGAERTVDVPLMALREV